MRETNFIQQKQRQWRELEAALEAPHPDPDKLRDQFVQITDDLSYARTFYPNRSVRVYLNGLAQRIFFTIYKSKRSPLKRIGNFWLEELPQLVYEARREFLLAFLIFLTAFGIGMLSSAMDSEFIDTILGKDYRMMTEQNIKSGDPMGVYKQRGQFGMSLGITFNNLWVAFLTFVMGVFYAVGSIAILIQNGIMVGAFQYFFIERGLFWESFLTIWIHGTLEISAIIIAGAAGITMGRGLVFPGTYTRAQSFQRAARRGVKIMIGIAPIIILAGFIEGYLTRHTATPDVLRGFFIIVCLLFILMYFVWYPRLRANYGFAKPIIDSKIPPNNVQGLQFNTIQSTGEIFANTFLFYRKYIGKIIGLSLVLALVVTGAVFVLTNGKPAEAFAFPSGLFGMFNGLRPFFSVGKLPVLAFIHLLTFTTLITIVFTWLQRETHSIENEQEPNFWQNLFKNLVPTGLLLLFICIQRWYAPYLLLLALPFGLLWAYVMQVEEWNVFDGIGRTWALRRNNIGLLSGLLIVLFLVSLLFFLITDTGVLWFFLQLIPWIIPIPEAQTATFSVMLLTFISFFVLHLVVVLFVAGFGLVYYTLQEVQEAVYLRQRIQEIGVVKRIRGLEQEG